MTDRYSGFFYIWLQPVFVTSFGTFRDTIGLIGSVTVTGFFGIGEYIVKKYRPGTQPCRLCGELMYENGDGWCCGDGESNDGFYSAHWKCTNPDPLGTFAVVFSNRIESTSEEMRRYTTKQRAMDDVNYLAAFNNAKWCFFVVNVDTGAVLFRAEGRVNNQ